MSEVFVIGTPNQYDAVLSMHETVSPGLCVCGDTSLNHEREDHLRAQIRKKLGTMVIPIERLLYPLDAAVTLMHTVRGTAHVSEWMSEPAPPELHMVNTACLWLFQQHQAHSLDDVGVQNLTRRDPRDLTDGGALDGLRQALQAHTILDMVWDENMGMELFFCSCDPDGVIPMSDTAMEAHRALAVRDAGTFCASPELLNAYGAELGNLANMFGYVFHRRPDLNTELYDAMCLSADSFRWELSRASHA